MGINIPLKAFLGLRTLTAACGEMSTYAFGFSLVTPLKALLAPCLTHFQNDLLSQVVSSHPRLTALTQYYISQPSKRLHPCLILLMSQATNGPGSEWLARSTTSACDQAGIRDPFLCTSLSASQRVLCNVSGQLDNILPSQFLLAQIIEVIHVASLLHDDVIDQSQTRRGAPSAPTVFGTCHTILGGDFLLGRTMVLGAKLGSQEAMSLIGEIICTLLLHAETRSLSDIDHTSQGVLLSALWDKYLVQTYMKTASLFSLALQCTVILGGATANDPWRQIATSYGECLGMAFQLIMIDDLLDYEGDQSVLGKPANADLKLGIATDPVFFALQEDESILPLVLRRFSRPGDAEKVMESVKNTQALLRTRKLAECYARKASDSLSVLPDSPAKQALGDLAAAVLVCKM
ncbi:isoprenoid synthase domain-containing protein [Fomes fomentarius]|nr:isoprenoid synthase domain-containing protein [Fomes fomentarius]